MIRASLRMRVEPPPFHQAGARHNWNSGVPTRRDDPPWLHGVPTPAMSGTLSNSLVDMDSKSRCGAEATAQWAGAPPTASSSIWPG